MTRRALPAMLVFACSFLPVAAAIQCGPPPPPPPTPSTFVLAAEKSMTIGTANVVTGDVAVRQILPAPNNTAITADGGVPPSTTSQLTIGKNSKVGSNASCVAVDSIFANSILIEKNACVGNINATEVTNNGASIGTQAPFPATPLTPLPLAPLPPSGSAINVPASTTLSIAPGHYGDLTVHKNATVSLGTGDYSFGAVLLDSGSAITTTSGSVSVSASTVTLTHASVAPGAGLHASDLTIAASGSVEFQANSSVTALVAAPHGDMSFAHGVSATGAFAAFTIETDHDVTVSFQDGFPASARGSQVLIGYYGHQPDGSFGVVAPVERDRRFALSFGLPIPNPLAAIAFVADVTNPKSANFRKFLTPAQFKTTFGASDVDYQTLERWAISHNLTIQTAYPNNLLLTVTGTAAQIEAALHINLIYRAGGKFAPGFLAVDREPSLDLAPNVLWVSGFTDYITSGQAACNFTLPGTCPPSTTCSCPPNLTCAPSPQVSEGIGALATGQAGNFTAPDMRQAYLGDPMVSTARTSTPNACELLTGVNQTVAILSLENYTLQQALADRLSYALAQPPGTPFGFVGNVTVLSNISSVGWLDSPTSETPSDMEAVMAMAPSANIKIFETATGITEHADDGLHAIANDSSITVATSSFYFGSSANSQQALLQMAAEGISYFTSSGDLGDVGDPNSYRSGSTTMDYQTLVGGTNLFGSQVVLGSSPRTGKPTLFYQQPYFGGEVTWNDGCPAEFGPPSNDITGGGVMNGCSPLWSECFPQPGCGKPGTCGATPTPIPGYQVGVPMNPVILASGGTGLANPFGGNGGSPQFRNYPDVSMNAQNFMNVVGSPSCATPGPGNNSCITQSNGVLVCCVGGFAGTSLSSPLWAGYMALVNEQAGTNGLPNRSGFLNDIVYPIGLTRGQPGAQDLYAATFHDINDGVFNQAPQPNPFNLGFPSVNGYDLATGWGSPTCALLQTLASSNPTAPQSFDQLYAHIESGADGLNDVTSVDLVVNASSGPQTFHIKAIGDPGWGDGLAHDIGPLVLSPALTPSAISSITINMFENGQGGSHADNWDIGGIQVRLGNATPGTPMGCVIDVSGNGACDVTQQSCNVNTLGDTSDSGVARLSESNDCASCTNGCTCGSGQGPSATFNTSAEGCAAWNPGPPSQPFAALEVIIDTGDDNLNKGDQLDLSVFDSSNTVRAARTIQRTIDDGFDNNTEHSKPFIPTVPLASSVVDHFTLVLSNEGNDEWHINGISIFGRGVTASGQDTCLYRSTGKIVMNSGFATLPLQRGSGCP